MNMKKVLMICAVFLSLAMTAKAQLGTPTTTVKDTFQITRIKYNGTELNKADWPATIIVEDALKIYISKYVYVKGKAQKVRGGYEYNAICKGKNTKVYVRRPPSYPRSMGNYSMGNYIIGDYDITVQTMEDAREILCDTGYSTSCYDGICRKCRSIHENSLLKESVCCQWDVGGRTIVSPDNNILFPENVIGVKGQITIKIGVNSVGKTINAEIVENETTINNPQLRRHLMDLAYKIQFMPKSSAPEEQIGTLVYTFK